MPNRILREGILTSERVNSLGLEAEVFYRRLISVADDFGRFHAHPSLLRAALFPLKLNTVHDDTMERLLEEVAQAGLVRVYQVDGKRYVELQDFRQQIRAKVSKYPNPQDGNPQDSIPQNSGQASAAQPHGKPQAPAHLGGGGDEVVCEGAGGAGAPPPTSPPFANDGTPPSAGASAAPPAVKNETARQTPEGSTPPHVRLAVKLREAGINITSAHPLAHGWAARGLTVAHALEAVALARMRKPNGRIAANYLAPIIDDMLDPASAVQGKGAAPPAWWSSEAATVTKGRELGLNARPGEAMAEYRARLSAAIARQGNPNPDART